MACPACGASVVSFPVAGEFREHAPDDAPAAAICTRCLTVSPADDAGSDPDPGPDPDVSRVSDAFPTGDAAVPFALALGLLSSLATNRAAIEELLTAVERAGADPLLAIDRLLADPTVDPTVDLERRRTQLESLLYE